MEVAYVRDAQLADVLVLSKTMRKADREEIMASNGVSALAELHELCANDVSACKRHCVWWWLCVWWCRLALHAGCVRVAKARLPM